MLTIEGKEYELKLTIGRLKLIEKATNGTSAMALLATDASGMMAITSLERFFAYGLKEAGSDSFVSPQKGIELCDAMLEEAGYAACVQAVHEAIMHDSPFLFRTE